MKRMNILDNKPKNHNKKKHPSIFLLLIKNIPKYFHHSSMSRIEEIKKFLKSLAPNELEQVNSIVNDSHSIVNDHHEHSIDSIIDN